MDGAFRLVWQIKSWPYCLPPPGVRGRIAASQGEHMPSAMRQALLLRGLLDGERAYLGPAYVSLGLSGRCNLTCLGCQYHSSQTRYPGHGTGAQSMPVDLAQRIAKGLADSGTRLVLVAGSGEPLLHPHWFEILSAFRRAGLEVELTTNGTLIDEAAAVRLMETGIRSVAVSIWAISADAFVKLCPGTDLKFLERKIEGLRLLAQAKAQRGAKRPIVKLKSTVNRYNHQSLGDMIRLAKELGIDGVSFGPYWDWSGEFESAAMSPSAIRDLLPELAEWAEMARGLGLRHNLNGLIARYRSGPTEYQHRPCYAAWFHANIRFDGMVNPCFQGVQIVGDLKQQNWPEIWNSSLYQAYRRQAAKVAGLHAPEAHCECTWCSHWHGNRQVHRWFRWMVPLLGRA